MSLLRPPIIFIIGQPSSDKSALLHRFSTDLGKICKVQSCTLSDDKLFRTQHHIPLLVSVAPAEASKLHETNLEHSHTVNLDEQSSDAALEQIKTLLKNHKAEEIGLFAALLASVEIGLGSFLKVLHVPFSGHFLSLLQNFLLILFGKPLQGRGLYLISFISASLKSFSPAGGKIKPMLYIFLQGCAFALPTTLLGWNFISVWIGSILTAWITVIIYLGLNSLIYGTVIIEAYVNLVNHILSFLHIPALGFYQLFGIILFIKSTLASLVFLFAWFFPLEILLNKAYQYLQKNQNKKPKALANSLNWKGAAKHALFDLLSPLFLLSLIMTLLLLSFLTEISRGELGLTLLRASILAWFGFVLSRRINFQWIESKLSNSGHNHWAHALNQAIQLLRKSK